MRILVTSGAGFIGSNLVRQILAETPHEVLNLDKLTYAGNLVSLDGVLDHPRHTFEPVDLCGQESVGRLFFNSLP